MIRQVLFGARSLRRFLTEYPVPLQTLFIFCPSGLSEDKFTKRSKLVSKRLRHSGACMRMRIIQLSCIISLQNSYSADQIYLDSNLAKEIWSAEYH